MKFALIAAIAILAGCESYRDIVAPAEAPSTEGGSSPRGPAGACMAQDQKRSPVLDCITCSVAGLRARLGAQQPLPLRAGSVVQPSAAWRQPFSSRA